MLLVFSACIEGGAGSFEFFFLGFAILFNKVISEGIIKGEEPGSIKKRLSKLERDAFKLDPESKEGQILIGLLLGDGWLIRNKSKSCTLYNTRFCFSQSVVNTDYFMFVYNIFKPYCQGPYYQFNRFSKLTGPFSGYQFNTLVFPCINFYYDLFYRQGKKQIPLNIIDYLTPVGLAFWISDDGTFHNRDHILTLCTDSFSESGVDLLIDVLTKKFELKCRKERKNTSFRIVIVKSSMDKLRSLVLKHMDSSMHYKLGVSVE